MTTTSETPWVIRRHEAADLPFIFDSWVKSYWDGVNKEPWPQTFHESRQVGVIGRHFNRDSFFTRGQRELISRCMLLSPCYVAHLQSDPDHLMGFSCGGNDTLHYVYVKSSFRRIGVGRSLAASAIGDGDTAVVCSHLTKHIDRVIVGRPWSFKPNWETE